MEKSFSFLLIIVFCGHVHATIWQSLLKSPEPQPPDTDTLPEQEQEVVLISGFVLYKMEDGDVKYIMLQKIKEHSDWTMPKGRVDPGESEKDGAIREMFEETGFLEGDYVPFYHTKFYFEYTTKDDVLKKVTLWPAKLTNFYKSIRLDEDEHQAYKWEDFEDAESIVKKQFREAFHDADAWIRGHEGVERVARKKIRKVQST